MSTKTKKPVLIFSILLLLLSVFIGSRVIQNSKNYQQYQIDKAETSSIRYGILNADEWEEHLSVIITKKVEEFELTPENKEQFKAQLETLMYRLLDEVNEILKNDMGTVKRFLVKTFVNLETLRESVPELADSMLEELSKPETKEELKNYILQKLNSFVTEIYKLDEQTKLQDILKKYECANKESAYLKLEYLSNKIYNTLFIDLLIFTSLLLFIFVVHTLQVKKGNYAGFYFLLAVVGIFMMTGISVPMINIEAKISSLTFHLLGEKISFTNQVLFFQSKSILDVVWILIKTWKVDMIIVGIMIFSFSVLFPFTKVLCSFIMLWNPKKYSKIKFIQFFTFKSGKWSMADVFVVAIFMAFIAFNGIVTSQLAQMSNVYDNVEILTTNGTSLQFGFYMFLIFCISGLFLSDLIQRKISN